MKVLLAGGGTAGHINPALAIAKHIKSKHPEAKILFAGTPGGMENTLVPREGFELRHIDVRGFKPGLSIKNLETLYKAARSLATADRIIEEFSPDAVVGTGGYVSGPLLYRAARRGLPTLIHEQNAFPGLTSKLLSRFVDKVMISFDDSRHYFKCQDKLILTGNPVREEIIFEKYHEARVKLNLDDRPFILSFAGSLGAREINRAMIDFIVRVKEDRRITLLHATGEFGFKWFPQSLKEAGVQLEKYPEIKIVPYIDNMPTVMAAADLVVCRAGAITLSELAVSGKPSILIPSPNVSHNHQEYNARAFERAGAAHVMLERDMSGESIKSELYRMLDDPSGLSSMREGAYSLAVYDSCEKIYDCMCRLIGKKKKKI